MIHLGNMDVAVLHRLLEAEMESPRHGETAEDLDYLRALDARILAPAFARKVREADEPDRLAYAAAASLERDCCHWCGGTGGGADRSCGSCRIGKALEVLEKTT